MAVQVGNRYRNLITQAYLHDGPARSVPRLDPSPALGVLRYWQIVRPVSALPAVLGRVFGHGVLRAGHATIEYQRRGTGKGQPRTPYLYPRCFYAAQSERGTGLCPGWAIHWLTAGGEMCRDLIDGSGVDWASLDRQLTHGPVPFDGIGDLVRFVTARTDVGNLYERVATFDIAAPVEARFDLSACRLERDTLSLSVVAESRAVTRCAAISVVAESGAGTIARRLITLPSRDFVADDTVAGRYRAEGRLQVPGTRAAVVHLMVGADTTERREIVAPGDAANQGSASELPPSVDPAVTALLPDAERTLTKPYYVFVSHIHEEEQLALALRTAIEVAFPEGVRVFVSSHAGDIRLGDDWFKEVERALTETDMMLLLLSPVSLGRPWVNFEAGAAWITKRHIVPLCVGGQRIETLPAPFNQKLAADFADPSAPAKLVGAIAAKSGCTAQVADMQPVLAAEAALRSSTADIVATASVSPPSAVQEPPAPSEPAYLPAYARSDQIFGWRLADAFPGLRGTEEVSDPAAAVTRLGILLRAPLAQRFAERTGVREDNPLWWFRGARTDMISGFQPLEKGRCLLNEQELTLARIVAVRAFSNPVRDFLYVEVSAEVPSGAYRVRDGEVQAELDAIRSEGPGSGYFVLEEYARWRGRLVTRAEYDDGSMVVDGLPTRLDGAEIRIRYLTPYNFIVVGRRHVINQAGADGPIASVLDSILLGSATITDIISIVRGLPNRPPAGL